MVCLWQPLYLTRIGQYNIDFLKFGTTSSDVLQRKSIFFAGPLNFLNKPLFWHCVTDYKLTTKSDRAISYFLMKEQRFELNKFIKVGVKLTATIILQNPLISDTVIWIKVKIMASFGFYSKFSSINVDHFYSTLPRNIHAGNSCNRWGDFRWLSQTSLDSMSSKFDERCRMEKCVLVALGVPCLRRWLSLGSVCDRNMAHWRTCAKLLETNRQTNIPNLHWGGGQKWLSLESLSLQIDLCLRLSFHGIVTVHSRGDTTSLIFFMQACVTKRLCTLIFVITSPTL